MNGGYGRTKAACYTGLVVQAIVNNFLPVLFIILQKEYGLRYEQLGRIIFINFCTQLAADALTPKITAKIGYRGAAIACQGFAALGLVLLAVLPGVFPDAYAGIVAAVVVYAFASGLMEVVLSPMVELLPTENKGANMAFLHSFYCWGQAFTVVITTVLVKGFGFGGWRWIPLIWAVIPVLDLLAFLKVPVVEPDAERKQTTLKELLRTREFVCFIIFMVCAGASEISMSEWASMFAQQGLGVSKVAGDLLGPCAFALCMGVGRVVYGHFSGRYSVRRALIFNNLLCCLCYLAVGLCKIPALALFACAFCGFSVSLSWPGTYSLAAARFPGGGTLMFSIFALCGDFGCSAGPWLLGVTADAAGLRSGFLVCTVFPLLMLLTALFLFREKDCISR